MGDQLEAIAAAGDPISVSPFDLDPGAAPVGFETIARIATGSPGKTDREAGRNHFGEPTKPH
ncbi:hypothetical protein [Bradyrhizobium sp.]|uniref:hypothetical protein n=1 Tax=Bradyrhizobium sp. TaxID=376 RepID=UPI003BAED793